MSELVQVLARATEAGADPTLLRSARNLVTRKGGEKEVETVKLYDRLERFKRMAAEGSSPGERENAERMAERAQRKEAREARACRRRRTVREGGHLV